MIGARCCRAPLRPSMREFHAGLVPIGGEPVGGLCARQNPLLQARSPRLCLWADPRCQGRQTAGHVACLAHCQHAFSRYSAQRKQFMPVSMMIGGDESCSRCEGGGQSESIGTMGAGKSSGGRTLGFSHRYSIRSSATSTVFLGGGQV